MPRPTLKQKLLRQPTRTYADHVQQQPTDVEPYWVTNKRRERERTSLLIAGTSTSTLSPAAGRGSFSSEPSTVSASRIKLERESQSRRSSTAYAREDNIDIRRQQDDHVVNLSQEEDVTELNVVQSSFTKSIPAATSSSVVWSTTSPEQIAQEDAEDDQEEQEEEMITDDATSSASVYFTPLASPGELPDLDPSSSSDSSSSSTVNTPDHLFISSIDPSPSTNAGIVPPARPSATAVRLTRIDTVKSSSSTPTTHSRSFTASTNTSKSAEDGEEEDLFSWASRSHSSLTTAYTSPSLSSTSLHAYPKDKDEIESKLVLPSQFMANTHVSTGANVKRWSPLSSSTVHSHSKSESQVQSRQQDPQPPGSRPTSTISTSSWDKDVRWLVPAASSNRSTLIADTSSNYTLTSSSSTVRQSPSLSPSPARQRPLSGLSPSSSPMPSKPPSTSTSPPPAPMPMPTPAELISGPSSTIGIPFSHPETGLPILTSIISVSRQSIGNTTGALMPDSNSGVRPLYPPDSKVYDDEEVRDEDSERRKEKRRSHQASSRRSGASSPSLSANGGGRTIRGQMSFILEEDESEYGSGGSGSASVISSAGAASHQLGRARARSAHSHSRASSMMNHSEVASYDEYNDGENHHWRSRTLSFPSLSASAARKSVISIHSTTSATSLSRRSTTTSTTYNQYQRSSRTVDLPFPLPSSYTDTSFGSGGGTGTSYSQTYGGLVLARAAFAPSKHPDRVSSVIDITKSGLAQTTMGTIEIVRGAADRVNTSSGQPLVSLGSKFGGSVASLLLLKNNNHSSSRLRKSGGRNSKSSTPRHLWMKEQASSTPLGFTSRHPPPSRLAPSQVLVQVFMVGLDALDALVVRDKAGWLPSGSGSGGAGDEYGFVPGRSFVGRAVEVGFEVRNCCKSDWVFGLLDLAKSGALAEFVIVDRRRVCRAPRATSSSPLSLEQIALLPLCGIPARRAIRTLAGIGPGKTALVLNGHNGVGALLVQSLAAQGVRVSVQVPASRTLALPLLSASAGDIAGRRSSLSQDDYSYDDHKSENEDAEGIAESSNTHSIPPSTAPSSWALTSSPDLEDIARLAGASFVKRGEPLVVIAELGNGAFDYVLDTIGGRRIWEASRWILKPGGQFTTIVGDRGSYDPDDHEDGGEDTTPPPYEGSSLKSSMRSIRSAMRRSSSSSAGKENTDHASKSASGSSNDSASSPTKRRNRAKGVRYEWVLPNAELDTEGEDVRDTLAAIADLAEQGRMVPWPKRVIPFEQTPEAFIPNRGVFGKGGVVVSKLIG